jgi:hypothetical protein
MTPGSLRNIYAFMSLTIVNQDTLAIVQKATGGGGVQPWPGQIFQSPSEEYLALLGESACTYTVLSFGNDGALHEQQQSNLRTL